MPFPAIVVHADWGSAPGKRWMAVAERSASGYRASAPELVGDLGTFWDRMRERAGGGRVFAGFDLPIGVPSAWAEAAGVESFRDLLEALGAGRWSRFYDLAEAPDEIALERPFYPAGVGAGSRRADVVNGLGLPNFDALRRRCERATETRRAANPLFWTVGGQQVGRAAIIGWRELLAPELRRDPDPLVLWPFDGPLDALLAGDAPVVAETYPAEAGLHLGLPAPGRGWSKTSQDGRRAQSGALLGWAETRGVALDDALRAQIADGFGEARSADDPFDAVVGLFGMLEVALGHRPCGAPDTDAVRSVEGWILGQPSTPAPPTSVATPTRSERAPDADRASALIDLLGLQPHPEGGHFRETFRSSDTVRPADGRGDRAALTTIHFLLRTGEVSRWHRVVSDEAWHHVEGAPLELWTADADGSGARPLRLGPLDDDAEAVRVVPAGAWQAARSTGDYTLVACVVGPGFEFDDFELIAPDHPAAARLGSGDGAVFI